jgi:hypothetical protein
MQGNVDEAELTTIGYMHMCIYSQAAHVAKRNGHPSSESSPVQSHSPPSVPLPGIFAQRHRPRRTLKQSPPCFLPFLQQTAKLMEKSKWESR